MVMNAVQSRGGVIFHKGAKRVVKQSDKFVWVSPPHSRRPKPDQGLTRRGIKAAVRQVFAAMPEKDRAEIIAIFRGQK